MVYPLCNVVCSKAGHVCGTKERNTGRVLISGSASTIAIATTFT
jgi:hypothetical protein